jgi:hypothetical protein
MRYSICLVVLLAGCAAPEKDYFSKPGASHEEMLRDHAECREKTSSGYAVVGGAALYSHMIGRCMSAKGWTEKPVREWEQK